MRLSTVLLLVGLLVCASSVSIGQLLNENFDYGETGNADILAVTSNWARHSGTAGPAYNNTSLSYSGYASSGVGGSISFTNGGSGVNDGDVNRTFTSVTSTGSVYVSFLLNVSSALSTADYCFHLGPSTISTTFRGRFFVRSNGAGWSVGLSKASETRVDDATILSFNTTYLVIMDYIFSITANDSVRLWVYSSGVPSSPGDGSPVVTINYTGASYGTTEPANIGTVAVRQGANTPTAIIDGIRISTNWNEAPLPVQMASVTVTANRLSATINWLTATEIDNYGFEIERRQLNTQDWTTAGFVAGKGNSNTPSEYSFTDAGLASGKYAYRIKQVNRDGSSEYFAAGEVEVGAADKKLTLEKNFPNPFNPSTSIEFTVPTDGGVTLKVYNLIGEEVATLIKGDATAGTIYKAAFNASELPSGLYFARLQHNGTSLVRKMLLTK